MPIISNQIFIRQNCRAVYSVTRIRIIKPRALDILNQRSYCLIKVIFLILRQFIISIGDSKQSNTFNHCFINTAIF
ncbi:hypothetical protein KDK82_1027 [Delftia sp. K82]|nr:hypothetical protein KDK82_1027 [Delftia sp. K82]